MAQKAADSGGITTGKQHKKILKGLRSGVPKGLCPGSAKKCKDSARKRRISPDSRGLVKTSRKEVDGRRDRWFITHGGLKEDGHGLNPSGGDRLIPVGGTRVVSPDGADLRHYYDDEYVTYLMSVPTGMTAVSFEEFVTAKIEEVERVAKETEEFLAQLEADMLKEAQESKEQDKVSPVAYSPTHLPLPDLEEETGRGTAETERGSAKRRKVLEEEEPPIAATPTVAQNGGQLGAGVGSFESLLY